MTYRGYEKKPTSSDVQPEGERVRFSQPESLKPEVPDAVVETMTDRSKEMMATLKPESKGFIGKLYEKIKSSEMVQNMVDRVEVWNNVRHGDRTHRKIEGLNQEKEGVEQEMEGESEIIDRTEADFKKIWEIYKSMGEQVPIDSIQKMQKENLGHLHKGDEAFTRALQIEGKIQDTKEELAAFEGKTNEARGRLDGRLAAKMEKNNVALKDLNEKHDNINFAVETDENRLKELEKGAEGFQSILEGSPIESLATLAREGLKKIEVERKVLISNIEKLEEARVKYDEQISDLEGNNVELQEKRDEIFPPKEKEEKEKKPQEKPQKLEFSQGGEMIVEYGGGKTLILSSEGIKKINPDGEIEETPFDDIDDDELLPFAGHSKELLKNFGVPEKMASRLETIRPKRETAKKFNSRELMLDWNQFTGKESGLQVNLKKGEKIIDLKTKEAVRDYLLELIAQKISKGQVSGLSKGIKALVDKYLGGKR